jgi:hypothetical protein
MKIHEQCCRKFIGFKYRGTVFEDLQKLRKVTMIYSKGAKTYILYKIQVAILIN